MTLKKVDFAPGFNKQSVPSALPGKWVDGDFVRFRYTAPEKIGGWEQLTASSLTLPGVARAQLTWTSLAGERYAAIGTSQGLFIYYGNDFFDITPLDTAITGCTLTTTTGSSLVTINKGSHGLAKGRYITLSSVTVTAASDFTPAQLEQAYEILSVPDVDKIVVQASTTETGSGMTAVGAATVNPYVEIGPTFQTAGYGWGTYLWGEEAWGNERTTTNVTLDPGNWSLDNFGEVLIATIKNGKTFTWNAGASNARTIRASLTTTNFNTTNNPTKTRMTLVSDRDRHLFHFGTETTVGDSLTQDPMFVRFSNQEDLNTYAPTATNTAGTFRLDTGNEIRAAIQGKDYVFVLTDLAAYVIQFVGPPFTFSVRQVGTNCGCIGQNAASYVNGAVYWMSNEGGFFMYDGTVKSLPCLVEDFVFTTQNGDLGINFDASEIVYSAPNSLYTEINWFYPKSGSIQIDRCVTYNYQENVWTTSSLDRTTYADKGVFNNPYATDYEPTVTPVFPLILGITNLYGASIYYSHEVGNDQVNSSGRTSINAFIRSGDFDIDDGEIFMSMRRFMPDYKFLVGNSKVTLFISDFPSEDQTGSPLGPFTITTFTEKVDTRARGRLLSLKIENDSIGETWRYGSFRMDAQPDGRR